MMTSELNLADGLSVQAPDSYSPPLYVASARKPDSVSQSIAVRFVSEDAVNVIVNKTTHLEVYSVSDFHDDDFDLENNNGNSNSNGNEKLLKADSKRMDLILDVPINGRVSSLFKYEPSGTKKENIIITTESCEYLVFSFDETLRNVICWRYADVSDRLARPCDINHITTVDPYNHYAIQYCYQGLLRVINLRQIKKNSSNKKSLAESHISNNIRLAELDIINLCFLDTANPAVSAIALLYMDTEGSINVKSGLIDLNENELRSYNLSVQYLDPTSHILIPANYDYIRGGVIILAQNSIVHVDSQNKVTISAINTTIFTSWCVLDPKGSRYLLGDDEGRLFVLILIKKVKNGEEIVDIRLEPLGITSVASSLTYLGNGFVYVGSRFGDSQLIQLSSKPSSKTKSFFRVINTYSNLGPITDFILTDLENNGQQQMVACCGADKEGSIRVIKTGIGFNVMTELENLDEVTGIWALPNLTKNYKSDNKIVLSFRQETKLLNDKGDGNLEPIESENNNSKDFIFNKQTLYCGAMKNKNIVQITNDELYIFNEDNLSLTYKWTIKENFSKKNIRIISGTSTIQQVVLLLSDNTIIYFELNSDSNGLAIRYEKRFEEEISCFDITTLDNQSDFSPYLVIGEWLTGKVSIYSLPTFELLEYQIINSILDSSEVIRSVKLANISSKKYLFIGLDNGKMISYRISAQKSIRSREGEPVEGRIKLINRKVVTLGRQPISFSNYTTLEGDTLLFVFSDSCTVIYGVNNKLQFSNLNTRDARFIVSTKIGDSDIFVMINSSDVFMNDVYTSTLRIGTIATIDNLHITKYQLDNEYAKRITLVPSEKVYALATIKGIWAGSIYPLTLTASNFEEIFYPSFPTNVSEFEPHIDDRALIDTRENQNKMRLRKELSFLKIYDSFNMGLIDSFEFLKGEMAYSITTLDLNHIKNPINVTVVDNKENVGSNDINDNNFMDIDKNDIESHNELICVGTTFVDNGEVEPRSGRILIFRIIKTDLNKDNNLSTRKLQLISVMKVPGCVYCLEVLDGKLLAAINGNVCLFNWTPSQTGNWNSVEKEIKLGELSLLCKYQDPILACSLSVKGDKVIIGDLMKSIYAVKVIKTINDHAKSISVFDKSTEKIENSESLDNGISTNLQTINNGKSKYNYEFGFIARDFNTQWMTSVAAISESYYLGAENFYNLFTTGLPVNPKTEFDARALIPNGWFHLGQMVNKIREGKLSNGVKETIQHLAQPLFVYGTVNGGLGVVASLDEDLYKLLDTLQTVFTEIQIVYKSLSSGNQLSSKNHKIISNYPGIHRLASKFSFGGTNINFRAFKNERYEIPPNNFIDGDLIEIFLNMSQSDQQFIVDRLNSTLKKQNKGVSILSDKYEQDVINDIENSELKDMDGEILNDNVEAKEIEALGNIKSYLYGNKSLTITILTSILDDLSRLH